MTWHLARSRSKTATSKDVLQSATETSVLESARMVMLGSAVNKAFSYEFFLSPKRNEEVTIKTSRGLDSGIDYRQLPLLWMPDGTYVSQYVSRQTDC
jgi:hypothetical protein